MAQPLITLLKSVDEKITERSTIQKQLYARIEELEEENAGLRQELQDNKALLAKATTDIEFLTMSYRLAESPDSIISTRRRIARLIRTIDSCISMLKEE